MWTEKFENENKNRIYTKHIDVSSFIFTGLIFYEKIPNHIWSICLEILKEQKLMNEILWHKLPFWIPHWISQNTDDIHINSFLVMQISKAVCSDWSALYSLINIIHCHINWLIWVVKYLQSESPSSVGGFKRYPQVSFLETLLTGEKNWGDLGSHFLKG